MNVIEKFQELEDNYPNNLKFKDIPNKMTQREDLHVFLLLDRLLPSDFEIVGGADHDIIYLGVDVEALEKVATDRDIEELYACGVFYSKEYDCLCIFV